MLELADYAFTIERHYGRPMDIEWAKDGLDGKLYIVQARPETVASQRSATMLETYVLDGKAGEVVLAEGRSVGEKIASGVAKRIDNLAHLSDFRPGEVLVADTTTPDWEPVMKTAAAIVTNRGGRTCHAAIIARELGIPAVVGAGDATTQRPRRRDRHGLLRRGRHRARLRRRGAASTSSGPRWRHAAAHAPRS